ncbi:MMPL family transporter [Holophaga foetida]|uniref:MMPL family transporter n=1 Tax=Holophaga foetida TaxID=35839 RepID=UPI0002474A32|nr:MMPL family transporter [Holophaga foetida]
MKRLLRLLLHLHLKRTRGRWAVLILLTLLLGAGACRIERRLDLFSLLPTEHPVVKASIEAGVGRQEILWLAAEGEAANLEARQAWAEGLVEKLLSENGVPMNGMSGEGRISQPVPVPGPMGASLWPPLLVAGSFLEGDPPANRLVTEELYALAPVLLGDRLASLTDPAEVRRRFQATARDLGSPDPAKARIAAVDPLGLRDRFPLQSETVERAHRGLSNFPLKLKTGYLETRDARFVLVPLVLDFPSSDARSTAKVLAWVGRGAQGELPRRASLEDVEGALAPTSGRSFPIQATGAHAIAYWESQQLGREVVLSLVLSFVLIGVVYWIGFRTLAGYGYVVGPLLLGMLWALGLTGWLLGRLNLMAAAFGAVLLGIGDDVGILIFSRYREERQAGRSKPMALRLALLGTGPGVVTGTLATALAFLACTFTPFPGFRDLGLTAGLGLLACLASSFLVLPALLLALDKGRGVFARREAPLAVPRPVKPWKLVLSGLLLVLAAWGARRMTWEEDLRRFRQTGNPALRLQESLGKALGAGLQPLELQIPLDDPEHFAQRWNRITEVLRREGVPMPAWETPSQELRMVLGSETWYRRTLEEAARAGLDPVALERPLAALRASAENPLAAPLSIQGLLPPPASERRKDPWTVMHWFQRHRSAAPASSYLALPLRLPEAAQDRVEAEAKAVGARMVGTRPLFRAIKEVARESLLQVIGLAFAAVLLVVAIFGRSWRFFFLALVPLVAGQLGVLGSLGLTGEPLTFLSLVAIPITLGVSVDTAMNLLHRSRHESGAAARVAKVNAVCACTTLAGFGGLVFSGYRGLRGLGLAALGGVALALLVTQWLLPWMVEKWPVGEGD